MEKKGKNKKNLLFLSLGVLVGLSIYTIVMLATGIFGRNNCLCDCDYPNCYYTGEEVQLNIDDAEVKYLYNMANGRRLGNYTRYYDEKKIVSEIPYEEKLFFAEKVYENFITQNINYNNMTATYYIEAEYVKYALEMVFDDVEYQQVDSIPYVCGVLEYDSKTDNYVGSLGCDGNTSYIQIYEDIVGAKKYDDVIEITTAVAYYSYDYEVFKEKDATEKLTSFSYDVDFSSEMTNYLRNNHENLHGYKYTFKLDETGFYKFYSMEKHK